MRHILLYVNTYGHEQSGTNTKLVSCIYPVMTGHWNLDPRSLFSVTTESSKGIEAPCFWVWVAHSSLCRWSIWSVHTAQVKSFSDHVPEAIPSRPNITYSEWVLYSSVRYYKICIAAREFQPLDLSPWSVRLDLLLRISRSPRPMIIATPSLSMCIWLSLHNNFFSAQALTKASLEVVARTSLRRLSPSSAPLYLIGWAAPKSLSWYYKNKGDLLALKDLEIFNFFFSLWNSKSRKRFEHQICTTRHYINNLTSYCKARQAHSIDVFFESFQRLCAKQQSM